MPSALESIQRLHSHLWGENVINVVQAGGKSYSTVDLTLFELLQNTCRENTLLIREEYEVAYDMILADTLREGRTIKYTFLVTGQEGIGKTLFLLYLLVRRLHEKQPVAFQVDPDHFILFSKDGASEHKSSSSSSFLIPKGAWALSDSLGNGDGPCLAFQLHRTHNIHTSSPAPRRGWAERLGATNYVMDVWSAEELQTLLYDSSPEIWAEPRIIVDILVKPNMEAQYLSDIKSGASSLTYEIPTAFWELRSLQYSSDLIFIRPNVSKWRVIPTLYIPTPFLASTLGIAISGQAAFEQRSFFRMLSGHPTLRSTAEWLFKSYAHAYFSTPNQPPLDGYLRRGRNPHHIPIPTRAVIGSNALKDIQLPFNFYWRSQGPGFSGVDALIHSGDVVWALQFTSTRASCSSGTATEGLDEVFEIMKNEGVVTWHLVIVALDLSSAGVCRDQQKLTGRWKRMRIYACELPLRRFDEDQQEHLQAMLDEANDTYPIDQRGDREVQMAEL